ncbi:MAG: DNA methyltransferase [Pyrinomonadaceae bacterium]
MNTLYYGDNLKILREHIATDSVDLIYLDPPFNSNRNYNVLFKNEIGVEADSQIKAFDDTWHWNRAAELTYNELINQPDDLGRMIEAFRGFIVGQGNYGNQMMAYLVMMAVRLKELHRVLKPTGSLYLHCDPTASHYLKILLDTIFGAQNFKSEIIWKRTSSHNSAKRWGPVHDVILFYSKSNEFIWNRVAQPYDDKYVDTFYRYQDDDGKRFRVGDLTGAGTRQGDSGKEWRRINPTSVGRHWAVPSIPNLTKEEIDALSVQQRLDRLDEIGLIYWPPKGKVPQFKRYLDLELGVAAQDVIYDIDPISPQAKELLGYPTQKPVALLERIIQASSNEDDVVLDPFCGCGTTIAAAQKLNRQWIGIDITHLSTGLMKLRLRDNFGLTPLQKPARKQGHTQEKLSTPQDGSENAGSAASGIRSRSTASTPNVESTLANARASASNSTYQVIGEPEDLDGARELAATDRYDFQWWILPLIGARALGAPQGQKHGKKGADSGIDGLMVFTDDNSGKAKKVIVSVKSGGVNVSQIRDLAHVVDREKAAIGVFVTLEEPTKPMIREAIGEGFYHSDGWNKDYPKLQILTVEEILSGKTVDLPPNITTYKRAGKIDAESDDQGRLGFA